MVGYVRAVAAACRVPGVRGAGCGDRGAGRGDQRVAGQGGASGAAGLAEQRQFLVPAVDGRPAGPQPPGARRRAGGDGSRGPGKQPGAPGAHLSWRDAPDERVPVRRAGRCGCGADLAGAADLGTVASHQQVDIPLVTARVRRVRPARGAVPVRAGDRRGRAGRGGHGGHGDVRAEPAGVVRVPDGGPRRPGAPLRGTDHFADRGGAVGRFRARHAGPGRGRGRAGEQADPLAGHHGARGVL